MMLAPCVWSVTAEPEPTVTDGLDLHRLGDPLLRVGLHRLITAHLGFKQRVHQGGLPQAALP